MKKLEITQPLAATDILHDAKNPKKKISHPVDEKRVIGQPKIFVGPANSRANPYPLWYQIAFQTWRI